MDRDLKSLYRTLTPRASGEAVEGRESAVDRISEGPLLPEQVDQLEELLKVAPEAVCLFFGKARGTDPVSVTEAQALIGELRARLSSPAEVIEYLERRRAPEAPPAGFGFDLYDPANLPIDVARRDFEDGADWFKYTVAGGVNAALHFAGLLPVDPIRRHGEYPGEFAYNLDRDAGKDLRLALFADFANGYYHALYIARRFVKNQYPYAVHLGDVYYAGTTDEVRSYLEQPMAEVLRSTEFFVLPGNHEMYAKGRPWLAYIDRKREADPKGQRQEGSYFRLLRAGGGGGFQIIGIDTDWLGYARFKDSGLKSWLARNLREGRKEGLINILLSSAEPYSYGKTGPTGLFERDIQPLAIEGLIDLWFWGNTHYCALFGRSDRFPFVGSCIGHAGYPYKLERGGKPTPAPVRFLEEQSRFGAGKWKDVRADRGNNGFVEMVLKDDQTIELHYFDWMGNARHDARIGRIGAGVVDFL